MTFKETRKVLHLLLKQKNGKLATYLDNYGIDVATLEKELQVVASLKNIAKEEK